MNTSTLGTATERVQRGAAVLDILWPGWRLNVNLDDLDMVSGYDCVLGQVMNVRTEGTRSYFGGVDMINDSVDPAVRAMIDRYADGDAVDVDCWLGFTEDEARPADPSGWTGRCMCPECQTDADRALNTGNVTYRDLDAAWRDAIMAPAAA